MIKKPETKIEWFLLIIAILCTVCVSMVILGSLFNKIGTW